MAECNREQADIPLWYVIEESLKHVVRLLVAVSSCMLLVVTYVLMTAGAPISSGPYLPQTPLSESGVATEVRFFHSLGNAFMLIGSIIATTVFMVALYYYRFYRAIKCWILAASCSLLFLSSSVFLFSTLTVFNFPIDIFSVAFIVWNFGASGLIVIHIQGPLVLQQAYLIAESAFLALFFISSLPEWTLWLVLALIGVWDLVAVLCVVGPLKILVETAKERNEGLQPGLVFTTVVVGNFAGMGSRSGAARRRSRDASVHALPTPSNSTSLRSLAGKMDELKMRFDPEETSLGPLAGKVEEPNIEVGSRQLQPSLPQPVRLGPALNGRNRRSDNSCESEFGGRGIKMGLGDFVFYSILVGKVATYGDLAVVSACFVAILMGMCVTLLLLCVFRSALPALPLSLGLGLVFRVFMVQIEELMSELEYQQVFV